jgi:hypothetical protein
LARPSKDNKQTEVSKTFSDIAFETEALQGITLLSPKGLEKKDGKMLSIHQISNQQAQATPKEGSKT